MKAIYSKIICTLALLFVLTGCVQNNGNIGPWFGQWKVERLTIDGKDDPDYAGNAFFRFQASVFSVCISYPDEHTSGTYYGTWTENGDYVDVVFNTKERAVPPHVYLKEQFRFRVIENNHKTKILEFVDEDTGITYTYYLKKW